MSDENLINSICEHTRTAFVVCNFQCCFLSVLFIYFYICLFTCFLFYFIWFFSISIVLLVYLLGGIHIFCYFCFCRLIYFVKMYIYLFICFALSNIFVLCLFCQSTAIKIPTRSIMSNDHLCTVAQTAILSVNDA